MKDSDFVQGALGKTMALLAAEHRAERAPAAVERAVLAVFDSRQKIRRRWGWMLTVATAGIAASLVAGAFLTGERKPAPSAAIVTTAAPVVPESTAPVKASKPVLKVRRRKRAPAPRMADAEQPFITIPYTVPLSPEEHAVVVRMTLSPSAMALAGFPLPAIDPDRPAEADVLVGEDGRARAIRPVANYK